MKGCLNSTSTYVPAKLTKDKLNLSSIISILSRKKEGKMSAVCIGRLLNLINHVYSGTSKTAVITKLYGKQQTLSNNYEFWNICD